MATNLLRQIRQAVEQLNPNEVRETAERPIIFRINATSEGYAEIEDFLAPRTISRNKRLEIMQWIYRAEDPSIPETTDLDVYELGLPLPEGAFVFDPSTPPQLVADVLAVKQELGLPLARCFPPFRKSVADKVIFDVSKENALFAIMTAMPDLMPGIALPWSIPEAMSDAAVLTINQIRMAFLLAAASDRPVGYREQKTEIASIIAGAVGWRALARNLVGKIPLGGGILAKAGVAFAATYVEGLSLERLYRVGYGYTRAERQLAYGAALARGRQVANALWNSIRRKRGERMYEQAMGIHPSP